MELLVRLYGKLQDPLSLLLQDEQERADSAQELPEPAEGDSCDAHFEASSCSEKSSSKHCFLSRMEGCFQSIRAQFFRSLRQAVKV